MNKFFKWIGILQADLVGILILAIISLKVSITSRMNETHDSRTEGNLVRY